MEKTCDNCANGTNCYLVVGRCKKRNKWEAKEMTDSYLSDKERVRELEKIINNAKNEMEALKKKDDWKPMGEWFFDCDFGVSDSDFGVSDSDYFEIGTYNRFDTEQEAKKMAKKVNAWLKLYHIAKHLNDGWESDWNDIKEYKYSIFNNHNSHKIEIIHTASCQRNSTIYFKTEKLAKEAIELMGDDLKLLFDD